MTNRSNTDIARTTLLLCTLFVVTILFGGCKSNLALDGAAGETRAEVQERHRVIVKTQKKQMQNDWDSVLLLNKSSKLSDKYIR